MPDDDKLTAARAEDLRACIAFALTSDSRLAKAQSAELMASIVAERLIARLERDGFVICAGRRQADTRRSGAVLRGRQVASLDVSLPCQARRELRRRHYETGEGVRTPGDSVAVITLSQNAGTVFLGG